MQIETVLSEIVETDQLQIVTVLSEIDTALMQIETVLSEIVETAPCHK